MCPIKLVHLADDAVPNPRAGWFGHDGDPMSNEQYACGRFDDELTKTLPTHARGDFAIQQCWPACIRLARMRLTSGRALLAPKLPDGANGFPVGLPR